MNQSLYLSRRRFVQGSSAIAMGCISGCAGSHSAPSKAEALSLSDFVAGMPKAELHVHLEGTVEPAVAMKIAARNNSELPYSSIKAFESALNFSSLESFLEAFHKTIAVLQTEEDFYEITRRYLEKSHAQNVLHVDLKFDPQAHQRRGVAFGTLISGINRARLETERELGVSSQLIMCFQRDASLESAELAFTEALKYQDSIVAVGLDNTEVLNFPAKFADLFRRAKAAGFRLTSHCDLGQPNSIEHIRACIEDLEIDRLDHGYNILEDERLVAIARDNQICFTACPTSAFNTPDPSKRFYFQAVCKAIEEMQQKGLVVTLNTDDPGVMGARYLNEVIEDAARSLELNQSQISALARNSFTSLWLPEERKRQYLKALDD